MGSWMRVSESVWNCSLCYEHGAGVACCCTGFMLSAAARLATHACNCAASRQIGSTWSDTLPALERMNRIFFIAHVRIDSALIAALNMSIAAFSTWSAHQNCFKGRGSDTHTMTHTSAV